MSSGNIETRTFEPRFAWTNRVPCDQLNFRSYLNMCGATKKMMYTVRDGVAPEERTVRK